MDFIKKLGKISFLLLLTSIILGFKMHDEKLSKPINYEVFVDEVIDSFIKEVNREFGYQCMSTGGSMPKDIESITVGFIAYRKATVEKARELEVTLIEKLLKIINSHKRIRPYLREYPFTSNRAHVSVAFWKKNNEPETENSISYVFQARNKLFYDTQDSNTDALITIAEETYEDALKIVQGKR